MTDMTVRSRTERTAWGGRSRKVETSLAVTKAGVVWRLDNNDLGDLDDCVIKTQ